MLKMIVQRICVGLALTFLSIATVATFDAAYAQRTMQAVVSVENERLPAGATIAQVDQAVLTALSTRGWTITARAPGSVDAQYARRDFSATIRVTYTAEAFSVAYVTSEGLSYDAASGKIHPNYNRWVNNLRVDVGRFVQNAMMGVPMGAPPAAAPAQ